MTPEQMQESADRLPPMKHCHECFSLVFNACKKCEHCGFSFFDSIDTLGLEPADIPHGTIVLEK